MMLGEKNIPYTIHGDFTHKRDWNGEDTCDDIDTSPIKRPEIWYSFNGDEFNKYQCNRHRFDYETPNEFILRVLNTCRTFGGYLRSIYCRFDNDKGVNVAQHIILESEPRPNVLVEECDDLYPIETASGYPIIADIKHTYVMNTVAQSFSEIDPEELRRVGTVALDLEAIKQKYLDQNNFEYEP